MKCSTSFYCELLTAADQHLTESLLLLLIHLQDLKPEEYTYTLTDAEVAEIIAGTDAILARGVKDEEDIKKVRGIPGIVAYASLHSIADIHVQSVEDGVIT